MKLQQYIRNKIAEEEINKFKNKNLKMYKWFQGTDFVNTFIKYGSVDIRWTHNENPCKEGVVPVKVPPYDYEYEGEVSVPDAYYYLGAEGFNVDISYDKNTGHTIRITL